MSQTPSIASTPAASAVRPDVQAAIARAAQATGVDFSYLLAQAKIESSLNPSARAGTSSAAGLYQFTKGTWLSMLDRHGAEHGLDWAAQAIDGGKVADPGLRAQVLALRFDPDSSALMAAELASDNRAALSGRLGREPDPAELYMAHFLGAEGAGRFLSALAADPTQSAAALLPDAAAANRTIFYQNGAPRSLSGVMELMRGKVSAAMDGASLPVGGAGEWAVASPAALGPVAQQFHTAAADMGAAAPIQRASMADTLANTFGLGGAGGGVPGHVRAAYGKLQALGL
ncbi:transglycosylase SLT domain-containing protein [Novosphingobium sp. B 225]|uniref:transglycosylase SLT domain-containing protein n=1 Tax=Novosphingobium sp. B 225 TaxID=1961849 RepID=UPI0020CDBB48|nr:transglycosylase SLT domain-containing protein [Novosphingobium sp. B 225]